MIVVEGRPIDEAVELDAGAIGKPEGTRLDAKVPEFPANTPPDEHARIALDKAIALFDNPEGDRHQRLLTATMMMAPFIKAGHFSAGEVRDALADAMTASGREPNPNEVESALRGALEFARPYEPRTNGEEFAAVPLPPEQPSAQPSGLRSRILSIAEIEELPDPRWLVDGLLPEQGLVITYGPPKHGKTFIALSMALHVAAGRDWFGKAVQQGGVAYIAGEGAGGLKLRIKAARARYGIPADIPFWALPRAVNFSDTKAVAELAELIRDTAGDKPVRLVVIDTLARAMRALTKTRPARSAR